MKKKYVLYDPMTHKVLFRTMEELERIFNTKSIACRLSKGQNYFAAYKAYIFYEYDKKQLQEVYRTFKHPDEAWKRFDDTYSCSTDGRVKRHYKSKDKIVIPYGKKHHRNPDKRYVKIHGKETALSRFIYDCFNSNFDQEQRIMFLDGDSYNCATYNLKEISKKELGLRTGYMSMAVPVERIDESGQVINWYRSIRQAAAENYLSHEAVRKHLKDNTKHTAGMIFRYSTDEYMDYC